MEETIHRDAEEFRRLAIENTILQDRIVQLESLLNHDPNTGLPIRRILERKLAELFLETQISGEKIGFGILRLDRHYARIRHTRDKMKVFLYMTALRVQEVIGKNLYQSDRSDEFLMIIRNVDDETHLERIAEDIESAVRRPHDPPAKDVAFGCHIGLALYPDHAQSVTEVMINAEIALGVYEQRREHRYIYTPEMGRVYHESLDIENELYQAIQRGLEGFHIVYQPIFDNDGKLTLCEALMRWDSAKFGSIPPSRFIPIAEESGRIIVLGRWIMYNACRTLKEWQERFDTRFGMTINVSPIQIQAPDFVEGVFDVLDSLKLSGEYLNIEVTEGAVMEDPLDAIQKLNRLRDRGIKVLIDDFGTGYSSLTYLGSLPLDVLKIAKPFIDDFLVNESNKEIIHTIIAMCRNFNFTTIAEGVERQEQFEGLKEVGCSLYQGFLFSPPVDAVEFEDHLLK